MFNQKSQGVQRSQKLHGFVGRTLMQSGFKQNLSGLATKSFEALHQDPQKSRQALIWPASSIPTPSVQHALLRSLPRRQRNDNAPPRPDTNPSKPLGPPQALHLKRQVLQRLFRNKHLEVNAFAIYIQYVVFEFGASGKLCQLNLDPRGEIQCGSTGYPGTCSRQRCQSIQAQILAVDHHEHILNCYSGQNMQRKPVWTWAANCYLPEVLWNCTQRHCKDAQ